MAQCVLYLIDLLSKSMPLPTSSVNNGHALDSVILLNSDDDGSALQSTIFQVCKAIKQDSSLTSLIDVNSLERLLLLHIGEHASLELRKQINHLLLIIRQGIASTEGNQRYEDPLSSPSCGENIFCQLPQPHRYVCKLISLISSERHCVTAGIAARCLLENSLIVEATLKYEKELVLAQQSEKGGPQLSLLPSCSEILFAHMNDSRCCNCSEAWLTFIKLATATPKLFVEYIQANFIRLATVFAGNIEGTNYIACRQTLRTLTTFLTEKEFSKARIRFVQSPALLCAVMKALNHSSEHVRYEAYHSFKVFLAYPNKILPIRYLLTCNRDAIAAFLENYVLMDPEDHQLANERLVLLKHLTALEPLNSEERALLSLTESD